MSQHQPVHMQRSYYDMILSAFVATLILSNIGSTKIISLGPITFDGGTILFPLAYIIGDILTEVYGFKRARRAIWIGFGVLVGMAAVLGIIQALPSATDWGNEEAFNTIAGFVPRLVGASLVAYLIGEFVNTILLSRLKVRTRGRYYWLRSLGASGIGGAIDTCVFSVIAFAGTIPNHELIKLIVSVYGLKLLFEMLVVPISARFVRHLKRSENSDVYDMPDAYKILG